MKTLASLFLLGAVSPLHAQFTEVVTRNERGETAAGSNHRLSVSADGNRIAWESNAGNVLDPGGIRAWRDVYVRNVLSGLVIRASRSSSGQLPGGDSSDPFLAPGGQHVAYTSTAPDLVAADTNLSRDVFWHELATGVTQRISVDSSGVEGNADSARPAVSADGRIVAFESLASNLVPGDTNGVADVFVRDVIAGTTSRVSVSSSGGEADGASRAPHVSADGRFVVFESDATNLDPGAPAGAGLFLADLSTGTVSSIDPGAAWGGGAAHHASLSGDGVLVAFQAPGPSGLEEIFLHDRTTGATLSVAPASSGHHGLPSLSPGGQFLAFQTTEPLLTGRTGSETWDVMLLDRATGIMSCQSVGSGGRPADGPSHGAQVADTGHVVFATEAQNLVPSAEPAGAPAQTAGSPGPDASPRMLGIRRGPTNLVAEPTAVVQGQPLDLWAGTTDPHSPIVLVVTRVQDTPVFFRLLTDRADGGGIWHLHVDSVRDFNRTRVTLQGLVIVDGVVTLTTGTTLSCP